MQIMKKNNIDLLAAMSDDDVSDLLRSVKREIFRLEKRIRNDSSAGIKSALFEAQIEHCYAKREAEIRDARRAAHIQYLQNLKIKPFQSEIGV